MQMPDTLLQYPKVSWVVRYHIERRNIPEVHTSRAGKVEDMPKGSPGGKYGKVQANIRGTVLHGLHTFPQ